MYSRPDGVEEDGSSCKGKDDNQIWNKLKVGGKQKSQALHLAKGGLEAYVVQSIADDSCMTSFNGHYASCYCSISSTLHHNKQCKTLSISISHRQQVSWAIQRGDTHLILQETCYFHHHYLQVGYSSLVRCDTYVLKDECSKVKGSSRSCCETSSIRAECGP